MPNLAGTTQFFTKSAENTVAMTLGGSVTGGVTTTVPVTNMSNYSDGDNVAFVVDPNSPATKQVFTGQKSGSNVINVVWTEGTNQAHTSGATVIDYVTATHWDLLLQGLLASHTANGTLKPGIVNSTALATGAVGTTQLADTSVTKAKLATGTTELGYQSGSPSVVLSTSYVTYATVTATSTGGAVRCTGNVSISDGNSGATRQGHIRVQLDGVTITDSDIVWQTNLTAAWTSVMTMPESTPSAGSHTWTLQVEADTASASLIKGYQFSVQEVK